MNLRRGLAAVSVAIAMFVTTAPSAHAAADDTTVSAKVGVPDYVGFAKAVRDDPIGFVNWKLELPIPDQYRVIAKP
ncbi:hypothetical protein ACFZB6_25320 [Streptomyces syringium]|uniref:hypothetical protein n=1 Tax=Streptomyces syringium TaxID=76729 RepID=UPI0036EE738E